MKIMYNLKDFLTGIAEKKEYPNGLELHLGRTELGAKEMKDLAMALQSGQCPQGLQLNLEYNLLGAKGIKALAMALKSGQCPQGLQLDLGDNQLGTRAQRILKTAWAVYEAQQQDNFINCMTLYQGHGQVASALNWLPPEMLQEICSHILPATPILAKMTEISTKVFRAQFATLKLADTSEPAKQLDKALAAALSVKKLTEKTTQIKTAINNFLPQELASLEPKAFVKSSTVALLDKFHLFADNKMRSAMLFYTHQPDEPEGHPSLKKIRL